MKRPIRRQIAEAIGTRNYGPDGVDQCTNAILSLLGTSAPAGAEPTDQEIHRVWASDTLAIADKALSLAQARIAELELRIAALERDNVALVKGWPDAWRPIDTAPTDGTLVLVYAAERDGLPAFQSTCAYHPEGGWCVDELRHATHWQPLPPAPGLRSQFTAAPATSPTPNFAAVWRHPMERK